MDRYYFFILEEAFVIRDFKFENYNKTLRSPRRVLLYAPERTGVLLEEDHLMRFSRVAAMCADEVDTAYCRQRDFRLTFHELTAEEEDAG